MAPNAITQKMSTSSVKPPSSKRSSPRKGIPMATNALLNQSRSKPVLTRNGINQLLSLRTAIGDAIEMLAFDEAEFWFDWMNSNYKEEMHWSDHYQRARILLLRGRPARCLSYLNETMNNVKSHHVNIVKGEAWRKCGNYAQLAELDVNIYAIEAKPEFFPPNWVPNVKEEKRVRARLLCLRGEGRVRWNAEHPDWYTDAASDYISAYTVSPRCVTACQRLYCEPHALLPPPARKQVVLHDAFNKEEAVWKMFEGEQFDIVIRTIEERWGLFPPDRLIPVYANALLFANEKRKLYDLAQRCVNECPDAGNTWYTVGLHYCGQGKEEDMRRYWLKGISKDDGCVPCWIGLGHSYGQAGDHDLAVNAYMASAHHYAVGSALPRLFLAAEYIQCRRATLATPLLDEVNDWNPDDPVFLNERAVCRAQLKDFRGALESIEAGLKCLDQLNPALKLALSINRQHIMLASLAVDQECVKVSPLKTLDLAQEYVSQLYIQYPTDQRVLRIRAFTFELCHRMSNKSKNILKMAIKAYEDYLDLIGGASKDKWASDQLSRLKSANSVGNSSLLLSSSSGDLTRYLMSSSADDMDIDEES